MPKARSYKNEPFSGFEKQSFSVLKDDFVHEKLLTVKANVESAKGGVNLKESLNKKGQSLTSTGQTKLWFFFKNNQSLYTKILPNAVTLAYDHGIQEKNNRFINWYGGVETNRNLNNNAWKLGVQVFSGKWSCNNLVQFNQNDQSLLYLHKFFSTHNNWFFNDYTTFDITRKAVNQSALLIAYKNAGQTNNDYSARFQVNGFSNLNELKTSLVDGNKLTLNWVNSQKNKYAHGVQFSSKLNKLCVSPSEFLKKLSGAFEVNMPEQSSVLKLRVDGNWTAALSLKHKLGNYGTYIWGAEVSEIGSKNNIRFGVQFDLNL